MRIPFNRPYVLGPEFSYLREAIDHGHLSGDGRFTAQCSKRLAELSGAVRALLTHSCTGALEMAALLVDVDPGDEVIMPSFTFVSTANAFVLRGATPVFVDIRTDTLNLDETLIEAAITPRTRVIVPVHYAGVGCEMDPILELAHRHEIRVVEDAAQALLSTYRGRPLGAVGDMGALSFHETKNVMSGEGGALLLRDNSMVLRAEIIREKGTNRSAFFRGEVDKYSWVDIGSSYLPSEIIAAFLWAQLQEAQALTAQRMAIWERYHAGFADLEREGHLRRPIVPEHCTHNAHMYYLLLPSLDVRQRVLADLRAAGIGAIFHYVPLHDSPAGRKYGRAAGELPVTAAAGERLIRLPLWIGVEPHVDEIIGATKESVMRHMTVAARS
jgi:dTDP-4-amino-4,6-dideoxygalactose transaminase